MEALIIGLLVPFVSALAFLAYNHPGPFVGIAKWLGNALAIAYAVLSLWDYSARNTSVAARMAIFDSKQIPPTCKTLAANAVTQSTDARALPITELTIALIIGLAYLMLLRLLPYVLKLKDKE